MLFIKVVSGGFKHPALERNSGVPVSMSDLIPDDFMDLPICWASDDNLGWVCPAHPPQQRPCGSPVFPRTVASNNRNPAVSLHSFHDFNLLVVRGCP